MFVVYAKSYDLFNTMQGVYITILDCLIKFNQLYCNKISKYSLIMTQYTIIVQYYIAKYS